MYQDQSKPNMDLNGKNALVNEFPDPNIRELALLEPPLDNIEKATVPIVRGADNDRYFRID